MKKIIKISILFSILLVLCGGSVLAELPENLQDPDRFKNGCIGTNGVWDGEKCICSPDTKYESNHCWTKTPTDACLEKGGYLSMRIWYGDNFFNIGYCVVDGEEISFDPIKAQSKTETLEKSKVRKPDIILAKLSSNSNTVNQVFVNILCYYLDDEEAILKLYGKIGEDGEWKLRYDTSPHETCSLSASDYSSNEVGTTYYYYATAVKDGVESEPTEISSITLRWPDCFDSDCDKEHKMGVNYFVKGTHKGKTDYCWDSEKLVEYFCSAENSTFSLHHKCPYGCQDGACLTEDGPYLMSKEEMKLRYLENQVLLIRERIALMTEEINKLMLSSFESSEIEILLEDIKREGGVDFSNVHLEKFEWRDNGFGNIVEVEGINFEMKGILSEQYSKIEDFLESEGFEFDVYNSGDGTIVGSSGYKKDKTVCIFSSKSGYMGSIPPWPEQGKMDVSAVCGKMD